MPGTLVKFWHKFCSCSGFGGNIVVFAAGHAGGFSGSEAAGAREFAG